MKKVYGIIGKPLEHSLSPVMHNAAFQHLDLDCVYLAFEVDLDKIDDALSGAKALGIQGLNVTIPLKERVVGHVELDPLARRIGAVNTIDLVRNKGYNTDGIGAMKALEDDGISIKDKRILILGAGGAARAVAFSFGNDASTVILANRTESRAVALSRDLIPWCSSEILSVALNEVESLLGDADILINATPVGMHPDRGSAILSAGSMHSDLVVFDIVYNPMDTKFLQEAKKVGAETVDGVKMLVYQGAESFRIFTGREAPVELMESVVREALSRGEWS